MFNFSIGVTALDTAQQGIDLTGQNLANINTPGYHRQTLTQAQLVDGNFNNGVQVLNVVRNVDQLAETAYTNNLYQSASTNAQLDPLQTVQTALSTGTGSLSDLIGQFYNQVTQLTADPSSAAQQNVVVTSLGNLTNQFNSVATQLGTTQTSVGTQITNAVAQVNQITPQIATLNQQIAQQTVAGQEPNALIDQRDQLINQLAGYVDVRTVNQPNGVVNVIGAGEPLVVSNISTQLQYTTSSTGQAVITPQGSTAPVTLQGGSLQGLLQVYNQTIPGYESSLNTLASSFAQGVDAVQATGLSTSGPLTLVSGTRPVTSTTAPLSSAGTEFPVQAGILDISVTNQSTGVITQDQVSINPATQSLQDVANAITSATGGQVQGSINTSTNTLQLQAQAGYSFDFAGRPPTAPTSSTLTGTTTPSLGGVYTGASNDSYTFTVSGSGTVGTTAGLSLNVTDGAGNTVQTLNIGSGYTPGTPLTVADGVTVQLSAGTATGGSFTYPVTSKPDTSGILVALGVNTALTGNSALSLAVNPSLSSDPASLAVSKTGEPGDTSNLQNLAATRDQLNLSGGTQTFEQYYSGIVSNVGSAVQTLQTQQTAQTNLSTQLDAQAQSVSGVNSDQELTNLLQYQKAYQLAAQYISTVNSTLDSLLAIQ